MACNSLMNGQLLIMFCVIYKYDICDRVRIDHFGTNLDLQILKIHVETNV